MFVFVRRQWERALCCMRFIHSAVHLSVYFINERSFTPSPRGKAKDVLNRPCRKILFMFLFCFFTNSYKYTRYNNKKHCCCVATMRLSKGSTNKYKHATNMGQNVKKTNKKRAEARGKWPECCFLLCYELLKVIRLHTRDASHSLAVVLGGGHLIVSGAEERGWMLHEVPEGNVGATVRPQIN